MPYMQHDRWVGDVPAREFHEARGAPVPRFRRFFDRPQMPSVRPIAAYWGAFRRKLVM